MAVLVQSDEVIAGSRLRRLGAPLGTAAAIGVASLALHWRDPHQHASWGLCPFKALTGLDCPGCGGLRAVNDLTHGNVGAAWHSNALFVSAIPLLVLFWVYWVSRTWTGEKTLLSPRLTRLATITLVGLGIAFAVFRNTGWGHTFYAS
jgi:hypothetical protein